MDSTQTQVDYQNDKSNVTFNTFEMPRLSSAAENLLDDVVQIKEENVFQFWESESTRPKFSGASSELRASLETVSKRSLHSCLHQPFQSLEQIRSQQFSRLQYLVEVAYETVPVYSQKYKAAGFKPSDLKTWEDFEKIPPITKDEMIRAGVENCVSSRFPMAELFCTRSFGTSGKTLPIRVNSDAILVDTLQGVRQFWLQSGMKYGSEELLAMIYTVPWWLESIGDQYLSAFISNLISPKKVTQILHEIQPHIISLYPTNLKALLPFMENWDREKLHLAVVHSEGSSAFERKAWSKQLGIPVLDEYSSEEATRIALELPCGHYHINEDAVYLEVLNPSDNQPQAAGQTGLSVISNLLNEAMPFIRYVQGDLVERPHQPSDCAVGWSQLGGLAGRVNDSFVNHFGRIIPAGTVLDITYRWMFDSGISVNEFELVQKTPGLVQSTFAVGGSLSEAKVQKSLSHLEELLELCMDHEVRVEGNVLKSFPKRSGKRRVIRRDFAI